MKHQMSANNETDNAYVDKADDQAMEIQTMIGSSSQVSLGGTRRKPSDRKKAKALKLVVDDYPVKGY